MARADQPLIRQSAREPSAKESGREETRDLSGRRSKDGRSETASFRLFFLLVFSFLLFSFSWISHLLSVRSDCSTSVSSLTFKGWCANRLVWDINHGAHKHLIEFSLSLFLSVSLFFCPVNLSTGACLKAERTLKTKYAVNHEARNKPERRYTYPPSAKRVERRAGGWPDTEA